MIQIRPLVAPRRRTLQDDERRESRVPAIRLFSSFFLKQNYFYLIARGNNSNLVRKVLMMRNVWVQSTTSSFNFCWRQSGIPGQLTGSKGSFSKKQVVNHIENHRELTNKAKLFFNLAKHSKKNKLQLEDIVPKTFAFCVDMGGEQLGSLQQFFQVFDLVKNNTPLKNLWIFKPADLNRGRGVSVFNSLRQLSILLEEFVTGKKSTGHRDPKESIRRCFESKDHILRGQRWVIIQKYIESPMLLSGRKFDIRMWLLLDHENKAYLYRQGYIRLSSEKYVTSTDSLQNNFVHLTNNAIQKMSPKYGSKEDGNQLPLRELQPLLRRGVAGMRRKMVDLVRVAIEAAGKTLWQRNKYTFELMGLDFMLDINENMYLIEVNTNPCLEESSALLQSLLPHLVNHTLQLTVDRLFQTPRQVQMEASQILHQKHSLNPYTNLNYKHQNLWDQIFEYKDY